MAIYLVNQGKTYKYEHAGSYIWSPKLDKAGHHNRGYDLMKLDKAIIFSIILVEKYLQ